MRNRIGSLIKQHVVLNAGIARSYLKVGRQTAIYTFAKDGRLDCKCMSTLEEWMGLLVAILILACVAFHQSPLELRDVLGPKVLADGKRQILTGHLVSASRG